MVFADRTLRMNCLTVDRLDCVVRMHLRGEEGRRAALTGRHGGQRDPRRGEEGRYSMEKKEQSQVQVDEPSTALIKPMKQKKCQGCWSGGLDCCIIIPHGSRPGILAWGTSMEED